MATFSFRRCGEFQIPIFPVALSSFLKNRTSFLRDSDSGSDGDVSGQGVSSVGSVEVQWWF